MRNEKITLLYERLSRDDDFTPFLNTMNEFYAHDTSLTMEDFGPYQISGLLVQQKIKIFSIHLARHGEGVNKTRTVKDPYGWCSSIIVQILKKRE